MQVSAYMHRYGAHWVVLVHTIPVYMSRLLPHIPPHTPPLTLPTLPFSLHTQYPVHLTTSYHLHQHRHLSIRPHLSLTPQSQEHTAVSQHGYPYAVLMSDSLTSSITMPVLQDTGLLLISVMLFMQGRCRVVVDWSPRNALMPKLSEGG